MKEKSLLVVPNSRLFREIRSRHLLSGNLFRPCMLIDEPAQGRDIALNHASRFTHPDAEVLFTELAEQMDEYARQLRPLADAAWEEFPRNKMNKGRVAAGYDA
jgi:hypothetical protein